MSDEPDVVSYPKFRMWLRSDGIVHLIWNAAAVIDLHDAVAAIDALVGLTGGQRAPLFVDTHDASTMSRPTRMEFVRRADLVSAVALLVSTPLSRMMGNFFLSVNKPTVPTQLFHDEAPALEWLKGFSA